MSDKRTAVVIGAGLGGLSAAIRLAARGWQVSVYEASETVGGKAGSMTHDGYRFDTGPSLFTMPYVFEELFQVAGRDLSDYVELIPLPEVCRYFYPDGVTFSAWSDEERFAEELYKATGERPGNLKRFLDYSSRIHSIAADMFINRSLHEAGSYLRFGFLASLFRLPGIDPMRTMAEAVERYFETPHARQLFERYATYNGSSPFRTPATLNIIPHVEYRGGAYAVAGGIHAVPRALEQLARELGVHIHQGKSVERITWTQDGRRRRATGVSVDGAHVSAHAVVCNADVTVAYRDLLAEPEAPELLRYESLEPSSSALVFYWGVKRSCPELTHHNIFFSRDYRREFQQIFGDRVSPKDPTVYINITSKSSPEDAPEDGENWFVLINAPYDDGQDWAAETQRARTAILATVSSRIGFDVEQYIQTEQVMTPADIAERTRSYRGSLYGISSNSRTAAFMRHPNRSKRYRGLYFCGGSCHPGGGMPLVVSGGRIVSDLILHHET